MNLANKIDKSIFAAENDIDTLDRDIFNITGFSSRKFKIFLNKLLSFPDMTYLEIGCWHGSTLCSALYNNKPERVFAIDNFSQFFDQGNPKENFIANIKKFITCNFKFFDVDCFSFDLNHIDHKVNTYFYDGDHKEEDQYKALSYYYPVLEDTFVYICDDFNFMDVRLGTFRAIRDLNLKAEKEWFLPASFNGDTDNWWNGCYIGILKK